MVEQLHGKEQVGSSILPNGSNSYNESQASVAQLVEHLIRNEEVAGSIPAAGSKWKRKK